jgi:hypothetical protein
MASFEGSEMKQALWLRCFRKGQQLRPAVEVYCSSKPGKSTPLPLAREPQ